MGSGVERKPFASEDGFLYQRISWPEDTAALQQDLDSLQDWERKWLVEFNPDKCEVFRITRKGNIIQGNYTIHNHVLNLTSKAKYLGVTNTNNLNWNHDMDQGCKKANSTPAFLWRNSPSCSRKTKEMCYKSIVRHLFSVRPLHPEQHQQTGKCTAPGCKIRAGRLPDHQQRHICLLLINNFLTIKNCYLVKDTSMIQQMGWGTTTTTKTSS